jgi:uncharacterized protein DUF6334
MITGLGPPMNEPDGETLSSVVARCSGTLLEVHRVRASDPITGDDILACDDLEALRFRFSDAELWVVCVAATDEIRLSFIGPEWPAPVVVNASGDPPWRKIVGLELRFAWFLQNERGYRDGVQLEFFRWPHADDVYRIAMEAAASRIQTFIVERA